MVERGVLPWAERPGVPVRAEVTLGPASANSQSNPGLLGHLPVASTTTFSPCLTLVNHPVSAQPKTSEPLSPETSIARPGWPTAVKPITWAKSRAERSSRPAMPPRRLRRRAWLSGAPSPWLARQNHVKTAYLSLLYAQSRQNQHFNPVTTTYKQPYAKSAF